MCAQVHCKFLECFLMGGLGLGLGLAVSHVWRMISIKLEQCCGDLWVMINVNLLIHVQVTKLCMYVGLRVSSCTLSRVMTNQKVMTWGPHCPNWTHSNETLRLDFIFYFFIIQQ